jgi:hypothetical protein
MKAGSIGRIATLVAGVGAIIALSYVLVVYYAASSARTYDYGSLASGENGLQVFVVKGDGNKWGLIRISNGAHAVNIILEPDEWDRLLDIWSKAKLAQAPIWRDVDKIDETTLFDRSHLAVESGPGIRFKLRQDDVCVVYNLPPSDFSAFETRIERVRRHLFLNIVENAVITDSAGPIRGARKTVELLTEPRDDPYEGCK